MPVIRLGLSLAALLFLVLLATTAVAAEGVGNATGLPIPRFVSLASDAVNVRTGPGTRYPILWQYRRRGLPVLVVEEVDAWRRVRDHDGAEGWVHTSLLSGRRTVMVQGGVRDLYRSPRRDGRILLRLEPGVLGQLDDCPDTWCRVTIEAGGRDQDGWLPRAELWGVFETASEPAAGPP